MSHRPIIYQNKNKALKTSRFYSINVWNIFFILQTWLLLYNRSALCSFPRALRVPHWCNTVLQHKRSTQTHYWELNASCRFLQDKVRQQKCPPDSKSPVITEWQKERKSWFHMHSAKNYKDNVCFWMLQSSFTKCWIYLRADCRHVSSRSVAIMPGWT